MKVPRLKTVWYEDQMMEGCDPDDLIDIGDAEEITDINHPMAKRIFGEQQGTMVLRTIDLVSFHPRLVMDIDGKRFIYPVSIAIKWKELHKD